MAMTNGVPNPPEAAVAIAKARAARGGASTGDRYKPGSGTAPIGDSDKFLHDHISFISVDVPKRKTMPSVAVDPDNDSDLYANSEGAACPACGGEGFQLGQLGRTVHHRCRNCGFTFS